MLYTEAMSLQHILLGLLREPASGYDLKAYFDKSVRYFWAAELSQIYPTLQRMEKAVLVLCQQSTYAGFQAWVSDIIEFNRRAK